MGLWLGLSAVKEGEAAGDFVGQGAGGVEAGVGFAAFGGVGGVFDVVGRGGGELGVEDLLAGGVGDGDGAFEVDLRAAGGGGGAEGESAGVFENLDADGIGLGGLIGEGQLQALADQLGDAAFADVFGGFGHGDFANLGMLDSGGGAVAWGIERGVAAGGEEEGEEGGEDTHECRVVGWGIAGKGDATRPATLRGGI